MNPNNIMFAAFIDELEKISVEQTSVPTRASVYRAPTRAIVYRAPTRAIVHRAPTRAIVQRNVAPTRTAVPTRTVRLQLKAPATTQRPTIESYPGANRHGVQQAAQVQATVARRMARGESVPIPARQGVERQQAAGWSNRY